jgi:hypothetical protein
MYQAYIDGNTIDEIVAAGEDFVYSDIYPQVSGVIGREKLYEALAGASEGFAQEELTIILNGLPFVSHERHDNVVLGWIDGMRGCNVAILSSITDAVDYLSDIRNSAKASGMLWDGE